MAALFLEQADRLSIEAALRERRELELVRHKMVALERLARSVVHDVNNVLAALEMIGATIELDGRPDVAQHGADVRRFVGLGGQLVQQLSLFGGEAVGPTELIDVRGLLREVEPVLARVVGAARFELDVTTAATVAIPRTELQQVLLNLCVNAGEAIASHPSPRGSGVVRVELREPRADEPISPTAVVLAVADDGRGMDAETQAHIFEPYFSRKQSGRGIGLAIVYGIVERAGGTILVDSAPGRGTTFRVVLPRSFDLPASGA
jgi:signal transduction histidine kinase